MLEKLLGVLFGALLILLPLGALQSAGKLIDKYAPFHHALALAEAAAPASASRGLSEQAESCRQSQRGEHDPHRAPPQRVAQQAAYE